MRIRVKDERRQPFHLVDKLVTWYWLPFIGHTGYTLYNLYISLVNYETKGAYPSIRRVAEFLDISENTIRKYNRLLAKYGLIRIERRKDPHSGGQLSHMYYILDAPPLPEDLQDEYERRKLVKSDLMRLRQLSDQVTEEGSEAGENNPGDANLPPPQSLQGGLQPLNQGVQPLQEGSSTTAGANIRSKKKKRKNNNTDTLVVADSESQLVKILRELGVHHRQAQRLVRNYDNQNIKHLYEYLLYRIGQGRAPDNPPAWLVAAITEDYQIPEAVKGQKKEEAKARAEAEKLQEALDAQKDKERDEFNEKRERLMDKLGVSEEAREVWASTIQELKARDKWSPVFELAFLEAVEGEGARVRVEAEVARQIIEKKEKHQALRSALRKVLGRTVYVTIVGAE